MGLLIEGEKFSYKKLPHLITSTLLIIIYGWQKNLISTNKIEITKQFELGSFRAFQV